MGQPLILLRTSERSTFMRCPQKWQWSYNDCLKPNYTAPPLRFGNLVHKSLAAYYIPGKVRTIGKQRRGPHPRDTFVRLYKAELETLPALRIYTEPDEWEDALELGVEMMENYVDHYGKDGRYRIVAPELPFQIDLHDPETDEYLCTYVGELDAVIEDLETEKIGLFEHKTTKSISTNHLSLDEQAGSYWAFAPDWLRARGILKLGQDLDFILYNFLRKGKKDQRPVNELGQSLNQDGITVSKNQPAPLFERIKVYRGIPDRAALMYRVIAQAREMQMYRDGTLPIYKRPMNGCVGMFSCEFRDMCEVHETGSDWQAVRDSMYHKWNPYEVHEMKGEAEA